MVALVVRLSDMPEDAWVEFVEYLWSEKASLADTVVGLDCQWALWGVL